MLATYGLDMRVLNGPIGAASALKMAFAGISKGTIAIVSAMILAAERAGSAEALRQELSESESALLKNMSVRVPRMYAQGTGAGSPRWKRSRPSPRKIPAAHDIWMGISALYERIAADVSRRPQGNRRARALLRRCKAWRIKHSNVVR